MPKAASYCIYETRHTRKECVVRGQCPACAAYQSGLFAPHFLAPAIVYTVTYLPPDEESAIENEWSWEVWCLLVSWNVDDMPRTERMWVQEEVC